MIKFAIKINRGVGKKNCSKGGGGGGKAKSIFSLHWGERGSGKQLFIYDNGCMGADIFLSFSQIVQVFFLYFFRSYFEPKRLCFNCSSNYETRIFCYVVMGGPGIS